jgi:predicted phage-related endonuclease
MVLIKNWLSWIERELGVLTMEGHDKSELVLIDDSFYDYINQYNLLGTKIKELETERELIKQLLQDAMEFKPVAYCGNIKLSLKEQVKESVDLKRLKVLYPEVYEELKKETRYFNFRLSSTI